MRKRRANDQTPQGEKLIPDCCVCIHRSGCELQAENSFCTRFQSREPERYGDPIDPNEAWKRGEDVEF